MIRQLSNHLRNLLSLQENALRNTSIFDLLLCDEDGLVREIVVDLDGPDSVVLESAFHDMFLEIGIESKDLAVILEPRWLYPWNGVIVWCLPLLHEGEVVDGGAHFIDEVSIDILLKELLLLLNRSVDEIELLSLMEVLLIGVMEDMARQERNLLRNVSLHLKLYFY